MFHKLIILKMSIWTQEQFLQMDINGDGFLSIDEALNVAGSEEEKVHNTYFGFM